MVFRKMGIRTKAELPYLNVQTSSIHKILKPQMCPMTSPNHENTIVPFSSKRKKRNILRVLQTNKRTNYLFVFQLEFLCTYFYRSVSAKNVCPALLNLYTNFDILCISCICHVMYAILIITIIFLYINFSLIF